MDLVQLHTFLHPLTSSNAPLRRMAQETRQETREMSELKCVYPNGSNIWPLVCHHLACYCTTTPPIIVCWRWRCRCWELLQGISFLSNVVHYLLFTFPISPLSLFPWHSDASSLLCCPPPGCNCQSCKQLLWFFPVSQSCIFSLHPRCSMFSIYEN